MPYVNCKICGVNFYAKPNHIKRGWCKFCSKKCAGIAHKRGRKLQCSVCGKEIWREPAQIARSKSKKYFCSKSCQTLWRNSYFSGERHWNYRSGRGVEYRNYLKRINREERCVSCGVKDKKILAVHHLDSDRTNNLSNNLVYLCMNCHFLVHRYNKVI